MKSQSCCEQSSQEYHSCGEGSSLWGGGGGEGPAGPAHVQEVTLLGAHSVVLAVALVTIGREEQEQEQEQTVIPS